MDFVAPLKRLSAVSTPATDDRLGAALCEVARVDLAP